MKNYSDILALIVDDSPVILSSIRRMLISLCQRQFKIDPLIDVIAEVKLTHPRN